MTDSSYLVPFADSAEDCFEEKRSKFTGRLYHVDTPEAAVAQLNALREQYRDATHHCWAYFIREGNYMRYSDDGEPQGTAGLPILDVLQHEKLTDLLCVVTRYFGGILLGKGGLVRAYTKGAQVAVAAAGVQQMQLFSVLLICTPYHLLEILLKALPEYDCTIDQTEYGVDVTLTVLQPAGMLDALNTALSDLSAGQVYAMPIEERFMGRRIK